MAQNWSYAVLSKMASKAGGPEKLVEQIHLDGKNTGRIEMLPVVGAAAVGASILTAVGIKLRDICKAKKQIKQEEVELAKEELIKGIREYAAELADEKEEEHNE